MIDVVTKQPMRVVPPSGPEVPYHLQIGPYIYVPLDQLPAVRAVLNRHGIYHWTNLAAVAAGGPPTIGFHFGRRGDAAAVQAALDSVP